VTTSNRAQSPANTPKIAGPTKATHTPAKLRVCKELPSRNPSLANAGGYCGADFVLDRVSSAVATLSSINVGQRRWRAAAFINDDYKASSNITVNLGIRYEYDEPWIESNNKTGNIDVSTGLVLYAGDVPTGVPVGCALCSNDAHYERNFNQIKPWLGFAYQAGGPFVIRGGYGATNFFEGNSSNQRVASITPFIKAVSVNIVTPTPTNPGSPRTARQGFGGGPVSCSDTFNVYPKKIQPA
jgi:hypothetical protein